MPLHDHPRMHGLLKCVAGQLKIQSYTKISDNQRELLVQREPADPKTLDDQSESSYLDEKVSNYHEIQALDEPAAFFDVLSPPYSDMNDSEEEDSRHCHFYRKMMIDNNILKLEQIDCPSHYYCDSLHFEKPDFMV